MRRFFSIFLKELISFPRLYFAWEKNSYLYVKFAAAAAADSNANTVEYFFFMFNLQRFPRRRKNSYTHIIAGIKLIYAKYETNKRKYKDSILSKQGCSFRSFDLIILIEISDKIKVTSARK